VKQQHKSIPVAILQCPTCQSGELQRTSSSLLCQNNECNATFHQQGDKSIFKTLDESDISDGLDRVKFFVKKFRAFYYFLYVVITPVLSSVFHRRRFIKKHIGADTLAINLGSGNSVLSDHIYNVDIFNYENVDLTCDIMNLPIKDSSVDYVFNIAVLEHVPEPEKAVAEIYRILKPGGYIYTVFPFMQGFHASPYDFSRRTSEGLKYLHKEFEKEELSCLGGPTSGMLWILQDWIAIVLSFGIKPLHKILHMLLVVLTFPLKFLDLLFKHYPTAENISSGFIYIGKK